MPKALLDANVVVGARLKRDQWHDAGTAIVRGMDAGDLPTGRITTYNVPEILTPIQRRGGDESARETLSLITESRGLEIGSAPRDDFERGLAVYRQEDAIELVDCVMVAHMRRAGIEYLYSFDDDFDRFDGITRLETAENPFE